MLYTHNVQVIVKFRASNMFVSSRLKNLLGIEPVTKLTSRIQLTHVLAIPEDGLLTRKALSIKDDTAKLQSSAICIKPTQFTIFRCAIGD